jgi:hypothetical protein
MLLPVDISRVFDRLTRSFDSGPELAIFLVVTLGATLFFAYLLGDGLYHRLKWRRLRRKFAEAGEDFRESQNPVSSAVTKPPEA